MKEFEDKLRELPPKLKEVFEDLFGELNEENLILKLKNKSFLEIIPIFSTLILDVFQNKEKLLKLLDIIPDFYLNEDLLILNSDVIDKNIYLDIRKILNISLSNNKSETIEICRQYFQALETKYPIQDLTPNLLLYRNFAPKFYKSMESTPIDKLSEEFNTILIKMIEQHQEKEFYFYFFDWVLKFGYAIEAYVKEFLITILKLRCLINNEDFNKIAKRNRMVGQLLKTLETEETLAILRNAIFHTSFILDYKVDFKKRNILFKDLKERDQEIKIEDFVWSYFKMIQIIQTHQLVFSNFILKINEQQLRNELNKVKTVLKGNIENLHNKANLVDQEQKDRLSRKIQQIFKKTLEDLQGKKKI